MLQVPASTLEKDAPRARCWSPYPVILLAAFVVTAPAIFGPVRTNDSFWIDWVWLDQFARELGAGNPYPRWLPLSHGGLGSPVFYYYPPLAFYTGSAFVLAGLSTYAALIATFFLTFALSGVGMYRWLKPQAQAPLFGALLFVVAPYHVYNLYTRGAIAESFATALLPFVMIGVRKIMAREGGLLMTALTYAALIMSHLPLALLGSIFLIGPYAFIHGRKDLRELSTVGLALMVGIGLAAIYLVPAILLEQYRDTAKLWHVAILKPSNWTFWNPSFSSSPNYMSVAAVGVALGVPLVTLAILHRSRWAIFGLLCVALALGAVPAFWSLPLLKSVQFPFRLLPVAEFALVTAVAMPPVSKLMRAMTAMVLLAVATPIARSENPPVMEMAVLEAVHPEVPENLPPGARPYSWPSTWALQIALDHQRPTHADGTTTIPAFFYPAWQVRCGGRPVPTFPDPETRLLSYRGPPHCETKIVFTSAEKFGIAVSAFALLGLLLIIAARRQCAAAQG